MVWMVLFIHFARGYREARPIICAQNQFPLFPAQQAQNPNACVLLITRRMTWYIVNEVGCWHHRERYIAALPNCKKCTYARALRTGNWILHSSFCANAEQIVYSNNLNLFNRSALAWCDVVHSRDRQSSGTTPHICNNQQCMYWHTCSLIHIYAIQSASTPHQISVSPLGLTTTISLRALEERL